MKSHVAPSLLLFGAFDRHNFGDLLFPHVLADLLRGQVLEFAGLVQRDMRAFGGHRIKALKDLKNSRPAHLIHAGGEVLTCTAYQAAIMLLDAGAAANAIARYDKDPVAAAKWAAGQLGTSRSMPYVVGRGAIAPSGRLIFNAVGGVEWASRTPGQREEARAALASADWVSVRDHLTRDALRAEGVEAALCPDPAVLVRARFGDRIARHQQQDAVKAIQVAFPRGYLACQFSADFGDDPSLDTLARGLSSVAAGTGLGLVLFRAGTAPWHDDLEIYAKMPGRLPPGTVRLFSSLHLWDICALIAASRGVISSSLHGRIVALAYGLPRVSLTPPQQGRSPDKVAAFAETWEPDAVPRSVEVSRIEPAVAQALAVPASVLRENAVHLREQYLQSHARWAGMVTCHP